MHHRNIQELLMGKGFKGGRSDHAAYRKNCNRGAHNSVDLWFNYLPSMGYGDTARRPNDKKKLSRISLSSRSNSSKNANNDPSARRVAMKMARAAVSTKSKLTADGKESGWNTVSRKR
jgi:hypothetical protein